MNAKNILLTVFSTNLQKYKTNQNEDDLAKLLQKHGIDYVEKDDYENAKEYLLRALEKNKSSEKKSLSWCGLTYLYLARNARYHNKWKEAEKYYEKSAKFLENSLANIKNKAKLSQTGKDTFIALCILYKWLQVCFLRNNTVSKVLPLYTKIQNLKKLNKNSVYFANIYPILVGNYVELENFKQAFQLITEGLKMYNSLPKNPKVRSSIAALWWSKANKHSK